MGDLVYHLTSLLLSAQQPEPLLDASTAVDMMAWLACMTIGMTCVSSCIVTFLVQ